ncbi:unnamed protein product [Cunninghamella blakesleeana]
MVTIGAKKPFIKCSKEVFDQFDKTGEHARNFSPKVANLLNHGVKVLIYVGNAGYVCNWYGNYAWTSQLKFKGSQKYSKSKLKPWKADGKEVGQVQAASGLTFIRIYEAGHEVPFYQPEVSLQTFIKVVKNLIF